MVRYEPSSAKDQQTVKDFSQPYSETDLVDDLIYNSDTLLAKSMILAKFSPSLLLMIARVKWV